ncbi:NADH-quinone oxidoreductase subunit K [Paracoccus aerius]
METLVACLAGFLVSMAIWLMLSGNLMRFLFGLLLLSNGVNLAILAAGRLTPARRRCWVRQARCRPTQWPTRCRRRCC